MNIKSILKILAFLIASSFIFSSCTSFLSDEIVAKSKAEAAEKMKKKPGDEQPDNNQTEDVPTSKDYIGTWEGTDTEDKKVEVAITEDKIWITTTDENGEKFRLVDGASYKVNEDGTITVKGKDKDGNTAEYKITIDENKNLVITDSDDKEITNCKKESDESPTPPAPLPPAQQPDSPSASETDTSANPSTSETPGTSETPTPSDSENPGTSENPTPSDPSTPSTPSDPTPPAPSEPENDITFTFPDFSDTQDSITADSTTVTKGATVTFTMPNTYSSYQWWIDSSPVSGATSSTYDWDTTEEDKGVHTIMCIVKDKNGKTYSATIKITVEGLIQIN